jgi:hypothetical protein
VAKPQTVVVSRHSLDGVHGDSTPKQSTTPTNRPVRCPRNDTFGSISCSPIIIIHGVACVGTSIPYSMRVGAVEKKQSCMLSVKRTPLKPTDRKRSQLGSDIIAEAVQQIAT